MARKTPRARFSLLQGANENVARPRDLPYENRTWLSERVHRVFVRTIRTSVDFDTSCRDERNFLFEMQKIFLKVYIYMCVCTFSLSGIIEIPVIVMRKNFVDLVLVRWLSNGISLTKIYGNWASLSRTKTWPLKSSPEPLQLYGDAKLSVKMTINSVVGVPLSRAKQQRETRSSPGGCGDFGFEPNSPSESSSKGRRRKRREKDSQDSTRSPLEEH